MDQLGTLIGVAIFYAIVFITGEWLFRKFTERLDARLHAGWRWLTLPITAVVCFAGFAAIRPLILDQPRTPSWFALGLISIALLVAGATALGYAVVGATAIGYGVVALGRWLVSALRGR